MIPAISMAYETAESDIMLREPRNAAVDRLVTRKLICFAYLQIGIIQAAAGFYTWMVVLNDYGYGPHILPGLGMNDQWGKQPLYCKLKGGMYCNDLPKNGGQECQTIDGYATMDYPMSTMGVGCAEVTKAYKASAFTSKPMQSKATPECPLALWTPGVDGVVEDCQFAYQNVRDPGDSKDPNNLPVSDDGKAMANAMRKGVWPKGTYTGVDSTTPAGFPSNTVQSFAALRALNYVPYYPLRARFSPFYDIKWWAHPTADSEDSQQMYMAGFQAESSVFLSYQPLRAIFLSSVPASGDQKGDCGGATTSSANTAIKAAQALFVAKNENAPANATQVEKVKFETKTKPLTRAYFKALAASPDVSVSTNGKMLATHFPAKGDKNYKSITEYANNRNFLYPYMKDEGTETKTYYTNAYSRMTQKEALHHSQGAFWVCIVVVQWADLIICKTRWLSIQSQGMENGVMNFGLFFETLLAAYLAYIVPFNTMFKTRNIRLVHWFPAMPFSMFIFGYDECRKFIMRSTSLVKTDEATGRQIREPGWLERNTYY